MPDTSAPPVVLYPSDQPTDDTRVLFYCPGCEGYHGVRVKGPAPTLWEWNGSMDRPTFSPSVLVNGHGEGVRCHLFVRGGRIEYLSDCDHHLRGQTVEMQPET